MSLINIWYIHFRVTPEIIKILVYLRVLVFYTLDEISYDDKDCRFRQFVFLLNKDPTVLSNDSFVTVTYKGK